MNHDDINELKFLISQLEAVNYEIGQRDLKNYVTTTQVAERDKLHDRVDKILKSSCNHIWTTKVDNNCHSINSGFSSSAVCKLCGKSSYPYNNAPSIK